MPRLLLVLFLSLASFASHAAGTDVADIERVMAAYHAALVAHDGAKVVSLFLPEGSLWLNVRPGTPLKLGNVQDFAKFVSGTDKALNPTHSNVKIQTDGAIASVTFDFIFLIDGKPVNRGAEAWQLVKGPDGWLIAALIYSSNPANP